MCLQEAALYGQYVYCPQKDRITLIRRVRSLEPLGGEAVLDRIIPDWAFCLAHDGFIGSYHPSYRAVIRLQEGLGSEQAVQQLLADAGII